MAFEAPFGRPTDDDARSPVPGDPAAMRVCDTRLSMRHPARLVAMAVAALPLAWSAAAQSAPRASQCALVGRIDSARVIVRPSSQEQFELVLIGAESDVLLPHDAGSPTMISTRGALRFSAEPRRVELVVARPFRSPDGDFSLEPGAQLIPASCDRGWVTGSVVLHWLRDQSGEDVPAAIVTDVRVPCDVLGLQQPASSTGQDEPTGGDALDGGRGRWVKMKSPGAPARLFRRPSHSAPWRQVDFDVFEARGARSDWLLVRRADGPLTIQGYVPASSVEPTEVLSGWPSGGDHPVPRYGVPEQPGPWQYRGPAMVRKGAAVRSEPDGGVWAQFVQPSEVMVRLRPSSVWVELTAVPKVTTRSESLNAWVHVDDVRRTDGGSLAPPTESSLLR